MKKVTYLFKTVLLLPLILSLFILDRILLAVFIHIESKNISSWLSDREQIKGSIIRVLIIYTILLLIYFIK